MARVQRSNTVTIKGHKRICLTPSGQVQVGSLQLRHSRTSFPTHIYRTFTTTCYRWPFIEFQLRKPIGTLTLNRQGTSRTGRRCQRVATKRIYPCTIVHLSLLIAADAPYATLGVAHQTLPRAAALSRSQLSPVIHAVWR